MVGVGSMTIRVNVDGWPYLVSSVGVVEVGRLFDGETVGVSGGGPVTVLLDEEELARQRAAIKRIRSEVSEWRWEIVEIMELGCGRLQMIERGELSETKTEVNRRDARSRFIKSLGPEVAPEIKKPKVDHG